MVDIAATVLRKIGECGAFVADVTPVGAAPNGKKLPNPNVVFELGYAYAKPGTGAIIAICNEAMHTPDDSPFDLRGKRVMTYSLPDETTSEQKKDELDSLTKKLTNALKRIAANARVEEAATKVIKGVEADPGNPSIWRDYRRFVLRSSVAAVVQVPETEKRSYIRVIPAPWQVPSITEVERVSGDLWPNSSGTSGSGNFGAVDFGYVKVWYTGQNDDGTYKAGNVAAFHEASGEWWFLDGSSVFERQNHTYFNALSALAEWRRCIRTANVNLDRLGASNLRKVVVGVAGTTEAIWPGNCARIFRKASMLHSAQRARWTAIDESDFLRDAYNIVLNGFSMEPLAREEFVKLLDNLP